MDRRGKQGDDERSAIARLVAERRTLFASSSPARHREFRLGLWRQLRRAPFSFVLVSPLTYSLIVPLALLDLFLAVYQRACFPVYGIIRVRRADFVVVDRYHLAYLNPFEKLNCAYCGYATGLIAYAREVAARTEEYWCPIKHSRPIATPHPRYVHFADYGDAEGYRRHQEELRDHATRPGDGMPMA